MASPDRYLAPDLRPSRILARIGLISDTHMPERLAELPTALAEALGGVDLILHAGDVGELSVLDRLSRIAPVVAVHGNDDTHEAQRELPYRQVVTVAGTRILLYHSHNPDRSKELAQRRDDADAWGPKLARISEVGRRAGASVVVFGHTHIPMAHPHDGVLLVNPGAIASPNATTRQLIRTVALLYLLEQASPIVAHVDLADSQRAFVPRIRWDEGFGAALDSVNESILDPDLAADWELFESLARSTSRDPETFAALKRALLRAAHRCWSGERRAITRDDLGTELGGEVGLPEPIRGQFLAALDRRA